MRRRSLFVAPLFALLLVGCGDKSTDTTVAAGTEAPVDTTAGSDVAASDVPTTDVAAVDSAADTNTPEVSETTGAAASPGPASFSIVSAVSGAWPTPVTKATPMSDIDTKALCTILLDGKAFGDLEGDYYGGSLSRIGDVLEFNCWFRRKAESPVPLDGFADAFLAGVKADGESLKGDENESVGLIEITLDGDPLGANEAGDQFIAANKGCLSGAKAVGLTGPWTTETLGSSNDNRIVTCRGPIPNEDVRTADPALVSGAVGTDAPPLD